MLERRALLAQGHDKWRSAVTEPRGSDVIVGALVSEPVDPANAAGVIFFNKTLATWECAATAPLAW